MVDYQSGVMGKVVATFIFLKLFKERVCLYTLVDLCPSKAKEDSTVSLELKLVSCELPSMGTELQSFARTVRLNNGAISPVSFEAVLTSACSVVKLTCQ